MVPSPGQERGSLLTFSCSTGSGYGSRGSMSLPAVTGAREGIRSSRAVGSPRL